MKIVIVHPNTQTIIDNDQIQIPINDIDGVENSSCLSVHLADCMDYIPLTERGKLLTKAFGKVRMGGEITISGTDLATICSNVFHRSINLEQANTSLFSGRLSCDNATNVIRMVEALGGELDNVQITGMYFSIKARRPNG